MSRSQAFRISLSKHKWLFGLMVIAWLARILLIQGGGQLYSIDETRYLRALRFDEMLLHFDVAGALKLLALSVDHTGYIVVSALPALAHQFAITLGGKSEYDMLWLPASILSLTSVAIIGLVYLIALRAGANRREAQLAALLGAFSSSLFYWSRHMVPYDSSLAILLFALWLSMAPRSPYRSFIVGLLVSFGILTYFGYWTLGLTIIAIHILKSNPTRLSLLRHGELVLLGVTFLPFCLHIVSLLDHIDPYLSELRDFTRTVVQGDYAEGWRLVWEYFWQTEHLMLIVWLISIGGVIWFQWKGKRSGISYRTIWLLIILTMYLELAVLSTGLHYAVVYGRLVRPMIPFFCLITAHVLTQLTKIPGWQRFRTISMAGLAVIAIPNFLPPLMIRQYPRDVVTQVVQQYGPVNQSTTLDNGTTRQIDVSGTSDYVLLNSDTAFQYPVLRSITPPEGTIIFSLPHPLQYIPLQYEDWTPTERGILRSTDISMRLVKVAKMPIDVQFGSTYMLSAVTFPDGHLVKQCQLLHLYGWWRVVTVPSQDYYVRWALGGPKNIVPQISDSILQNGPGTTLKPGQEFLTHGYILIPCDFPVGEFQVSLSLYDKATHTQVANDAAALISGSTAQIGSLRVVSSDR